MAHRRTQQIGPILRPGQTKQNCTRCSRLTSRCVGPKNNIQPVTKHPFARLENTLLYKMKILGGSLHLAQPHRKAPYNPYTHIPTLSIRHTHRLCEPRRKKRPPCSKYGECKNPVQDVGDHVCHTCNRPVHNLCLQALNGVGDRPEGRFVCGRNQRWGLEQQLAFGATSPSSRACTTRSKCTCGTKGPVNVKKVCCQGCCHLWCARLPCGSCDQEDGTEEGENNLNDESEQRQTCTWAIVMSCAFSLP